MNHRNNTNNRIKRILYPVLCLLVFYAQYTTCIEEQSLELDALKELNLYWPHLVYPNDGDINSTECENWSREGSTDQERIVTCHNNHVAKLVFEDQPDMDTSMPYAVGNFHYLNTLIFKNVNVTGPLPATLNTYFNFFEIQVINTKSCGDMPPQFFRLNSRENYINRVYIPGYSPEPPQDLDCSDPEYPIPQYTVNGWFCRNAQPERDNCIDLCGPPLNKSLECPENTVCVSNWTNYECIPVQSDSESLASVSSSSSSSLPEQTVDSSSVASSNDTSLETSSLDDNSSSSDDSNSSSSDDNSSSSSVGDDIQQEPRHVNPDHKKFLHDKENNDIPMESNGASRLG